jgi:3-dehydroquinate synthase
VRVIAPFRVVKQQTGSYPVWVGRGLADRVGEVIPELGSYGGVAVLAGEGVASTWGARVHSSIGGSVPLISFEDSEENKGIATVERIIGAMLEHGIGRDWLTVIVGGGTAGDTAGFAASIFMRGISFLHVPTTLLAQVDSSIGGKVGVNHRRGKNLVGTFAPPVAVVSDIDTLSTLPARELRSGLYEALKAGVLGDRDLFDTMVSQREAILSRGPILEMVVAAAIDVKIAIVSMDEREGDRRRLLNYGHTIGHGFEAATGYRMITHGDAVGWGMIAANAIARKRGILAAPEQTALDEAILSWGLEPLPPMDRTEILSAITHDKKFRGGKRVMVFPLEIGKCEVFDDVSEEEMVLGVDAALGASARKSSEL